MDSWKFACTETAIFLFGVWVSSMFPDFSHWIWPVVALMLFLFGMGKFDTPTNWIFRREKKPADDNIHAELVALARRVQRGEATFEQEKRYHTILARHPLYWHDNPEDYEKIIQKARSLARFA